MSAVEYTITLLKAPKNSRQKISVLLTGFAPIWKSEGYSFKVQLEQGPAGRLYSEISKLWPPTQVSFTPIPTGAAPHPTMHQDPLTGEMHRSVKPVSPSFDQRTVAPSVDLADEDAEGSEVPWHYEVTRPEDLTKVETMSRTKRQRKEGKRHIRLGVHGERNYLVEPVRFEGDPDNGKWRVHACQADGSKVRLGAATEWPRALAFIHVYETRLTSSGPPALLNQAAPTEIVPVDGAAANAKTFRDFLVAVESGADEDDDEDDGESSHGESPSAADAFAELADDQTDEKSNP